MSAESRARFAAVVREKPVDTTLACLLIGCEVEPDLSLDAAYAALDRLAGGVRLASRSGLSSSTTFSNGRSWCANA